jgi:hypothetical protein
MARLLATNIKTTRRTTQNRAKSHPNRFFREAKGRMVKTTSNKKEPIGEEEGWCTDEPQWSRISSSNLLPCEKSQEAYSIGGRSPPIFAIG